MKGRVAKGGGESTLDESRAAPENRALGGGERDTVMATLRIVSVLRVLGGFVEDFWICWYVLVGYGMKRGTAEEESGLEWSLLDQSCSAKYGFWGLGGARAKK